MSDMEIGGELYLDIWKPTEKDIEKAKNDIRMMIQSCIEDCGEYEEAKKYKKQLEVIYQNKDKNKIRDIIQDFYLDEYYSVPYDYIEKCFGKEEKEFLFKVLGVKEVEFDPYVEYLKLKAGEKSLLAQ